MAHRSIERTCPLPNRQLDGQQFDDPRFWQLPNRKRIFLQETSNLINHRPHRLTKRSYGVGQVAPSCAML